MALYKCTWRRQLTVTTAAHSCSCLCCQKLFSLVRALLCIQLSHIIQAAMHNPAPGQLAQCRVLQKCSFRSHVA